MFMFQQEPKTTSINVLDVMANPSFYSGSAAVEKWRRVQAGLPIGNLARTDEDQRWLVAQRKRLASRYTPSSPAVPRQRTLAEQAASLEGAYHEAAHATVAHLHYAYPVSGVALDDDSDGASTWFRIYGSKHSNRSDLVVIALAGPMAVARWKGTTYKKGDYRSNRLDERDIENLLGRGYENLPSYWDMETKAELAVNRYWSVIKSLAHNLYRRRVLSESDLLRFFGGFN